MSINNINVTKFNRLKRSLRCEVDDTYKRTQVTLPNKDLDVDVKRIQECRTRRLYLPHLVTLRYNSLFVWKLTTTSGSLQLYPEFIYTLISWLCQSLPSLVKDYSTGLYKLTFSSVGQLASVCVRRTPWFWFAAAEPVDLSLCWTPPLPETANK